ncbi:hypothetical protein PI124_g18672 [Phytophthora idaei]|nr:hypothetical protein PI125_g19528 [Phytophthora idaei]KAG3133194.1 hypothetical protein PI126_g19284 [Phytophthora idaei]KAG3236321.1 hypothetical protein PI124_g18672 [Phytophthora idaei]
MVEMLLDSLPNQLELEDMKAAIRYNPNYGAFTPDSVRDMIRAADSRQKEFWNKNNGRRGNQKHEGSSGGSKESSAKNSQSQQETSKDSKKVRKCHICESTEHLKADCPERVKVQSGGGATASEQKRKPRGNVTIRRNENEPLRPEREDAEVGVVTGVLDAMMIDARVEAGVSGESQHSSSENEGQEKNAVDESQDLVNTNSGWWYFDTAANIHLTGNQSYYVAFTEDTSQSQSVHGVTTTLASRIAGVGTVAIVSEVDGEPVVVYLNDVFCVPGAEHGLLSPGPAAEQGFDFYYDRETMNFRVMDERRTVIVATTQESTWGFFVTHPSHGAIVGPQDRPLCNFTAAEGVA